MKYGFLVNSGVFLFLFIPQTVKILQTGKRTAGRLRQLPFLVDGRSMVLLLGLSSRSV